MIIFYLFKLITTGFLVFFLTILVFWLLICSLVSSFGSGKEIMEFYTLIIAILNAGIKYLGGIITEIGKTNLIGNTKIEDIAIGVKNIVGEVVTQVSTGSKAVGNAVGNVVIEGAEGISKGSQAVGGIAMEGLEAVDPMTGILSTSKELGENIKSIYTGNKELIENIIESTIFHVLKDENRGDGTNNINSIEEGLKSLRTLLICLKFLLAFEWLELVFIVTVIAVIVKVSIIIQTLLSRTIISEITTSPYVFLLITYTIVTGFTILFVIIHVALTRKKGVAKLYLNMLSTGLSFTFILVLATTFISKTIETENESLKFQLQAPNFMLTSLAVVSCFFTIILDQMGFFDSKSIQFNFIIVMITGVLMIILNLLPLKSIAIGIIQIVKAPFTEIFDFTLLSGPVIKTLIVLIGVLTYFYFSIVR